MSQKTTKSKQTTKAAGKPKAKKGKAADAATELSQQPAPEARPTEASAIAETTAVEAEASAELETGSMQIKKDAKGRFWVVLKDGGQEHGPFDTKKEATDAKAPIASGATPAAATETKPAHAKKVKEPKPKRVSALDAAAQVLAASSEPMNCMAMVEAMATQGLWSSPGGATPHATLYSAIIREIATKGAESRFVKKDRGMFATAGA
jgi:hypothetical protein